MERWRGGEVERWERRARDSAWGGASVVRGLPNSDTFFPFHPVMRRLFF